MTMQIITKVSLEESVLEGLVRVLDVVLPGTELSPSGRAVGVHREPLELVLQTDPSLISPVRAAGAAAATATDVTFTDLELWCGEDLERVVFALTSAYYMIDDVRAAIGYPGQGRAPIAEATPEQVASDELVAPVVARGPVYVPTPR